MLVGLVLVIGALLWLSTRPSLSAGAGITVPGYSEAEQEEVIEQPVFELSRPDSRPAETDTESETKETKVVEGPRYHMVLDGETLSGISYQYYGSVNKWQKILDANRDVIKDVKNLKPRTTLLIPE